MSQITDITQLRKTARMAVETGELERASAAYRELAEATNAPEAWEGLGLSAWWLQDTTGMLEARLKAYRLYQEGGDVVAAARMAIALGNDFLDFRGDAAVANGWFKRARRLLEPLPPSAEHTRLLVWEARLALIGRQDTTEATRLAEEALRLARTGDCADAEVLALAMRGLALVMAAQPREGLALLDEAAAAALGGDISDPYAAGLTCCYMISACDRVRDYERAAQWCARLREFSTRQRFAILLTTCKLQYGSVLTSRGAFAEADAELTAAIKDLSEARPVVLPAAYARLGELRRRQGRTADATALFEQAGAHPLALLGGAWIDLERGAMDSAADRVHTYLRRFPSDALLERAPANELMVRIAAASGVDGSTALAELNRAADAHDLPLLRAAALAAAGVLADAAGDQRHAIELLEDACALYEESGLGYEADATRRALDAARLRRPATGETDGAEAAASQLTKRERDVLLLIARGMSEREVADALFISPHTAHRHLSNIRLKLGVANQAAAVAHALRIGIL